MEHVFTDTVYWIARANPNDQWHKASIKAVAELGTVKFVTTEAVLMEFLTGLSGKSYLRSKAATFVRNIRENANIIIVPQTQDLFREALDMYEQRLDKTYSFQDCISMIVMKKRSITRVLTSDTHFTQEGFVILM